MLLELFLTFFKIGIVTFGGGYAMLPMIQSEVVAHGWMELSELINFIAVSESTPGPFAVNVSTFVGMQTAGILGACCATLGVVLPSFLVILIVAQFYAKFQKSFAVKGCMSGLKPAVIGMIGSAVLSVGRTVFFPDGLSLSAVPTYGFITSLVIFVPMLILVFRKLHPIFIVLISAAMGIGFGYLSLL